MPLQQIPVAGASFRGLASGDGGVNVAFADVHVKWQITVVLCEQARRVGADGTSAPLNDGYWDPRNS